MSWIPLMVAVLVFLSVFITIVVRAYIQLKQ